MPTAKPMQTPAAVSAKPRQPSGQGMGERRVALLDGTGRLGDVVDALRKDPGRAGLLLLASWNLFCKDWPVTPLPESYGDVVTSDIPTLVFSGEYDPITPPANSKAVADACGFHHSGSVVVPTDHGAPSALLYVRLASDQPPRPRP